MGWVLVHVQDDAVTVVVTRNSVCVYIHMQIYMPAWLCMLFEPPSRSRDGSGSKAGNSGSHRVRSVVCALALLPVIMANIVRILLVKNFTRLAPLHNAQKTTQGCESTTSIC